MNRCLSSTKALAGAIACGVLAQGAVAQTSDSEIQAELQALRAEVAELRQEQGTSDNWMSERRSAETRAMIEDVLADAQARASLLQDGSTAGHSGKKFFLSSAEGDFTLNIGGQFQFRWLVDLQSDRADEVESGFQVRRMKVKFSGVVGYIDRGPIKYAVTLAGDRGDGVVEVEDYYVTLPVADGVTITMGKFKIPFLRQELTSSSRQIAVDRGLATEYFTLDRSEQIVINYKGDNFVFNFSINDGADEEFSNFGSDPVEIAFAARGEYVVMGSASQGKDTFAWDGEDQFLVIGGALFYQVGDGINGDNSSESDADYFAWTVDALYENAGFAIMAAIMGGHISIDGDPSGPSPLLDRDMIGALVEASYFVVPDTLAPFVRFEWIDPDIAGADDVLALTFGINYFLKKHNAKFTADVIWVFEGDNTSNPFGNSEFSSGLGFSSFSSADSDDLIAIRTQFQLLW